MKSTHAPQPGGRPDAADCRTTIRSGLFAHFAVETGREAEFEASLRSALPLVAKERITPEWYAIQLGASRYGVFDVFPNEPSRAVHLAGPVGHTLSEHGGPLLASPPELERFDVFAQKTPLATAESAANGLLLTFAAREGAAADIESFLCDAAALAHKENEAVVWFAIGFGNLRYGSFAVFHEATARFAHLVASVPHELGKKCLAMLSGAPDVTMFNVLCAKIAAL